MIDTPAARTQRLIEAWGHVTADSDRAEADPLVQDCARRLLTDPGGGTAYLWTFGLVRMAGYLAWQPGQEAARSALDALRAVDRALGGPPCAHPSHPYEGTLKGLLADEVWLAGPDLMSLVGPAAEDGVWRCPANVAGFARLTADVLAPFTVRGIPGLIPDAHTSSLSNLSSVLNGYPYGDPGEELSFQAGGLPRHPTQGVLAGYVVTLHASQWYATSGLITEKRVLDDMIAGLEAALPLLGDAPCARTVAEHPGLDSDPSGNARTGYLLRSPGGRAELRSWHADAPLERWLCHDFLRGLAHEALGNLRYARDSLFGIRDDRLLDAEYLRPDGRLDIGALTHCFDEAEYDTSWQAENAVRWAARRYAATEDGSPRERLVLLLLVLWCAGTAELAPDVGEEIRDLLVGARTVPSDSACAHADAHPPEYPDFEAHLNHLYAPDEFDAPEEARGAGAWGCPRYLAGLAEDALAALT
ncbi:hypothetical protein [Streptomyces sp. G7(2002)]|uniref:hypothetical protein n=1 Tax=Streptomyces sp. G7(2002) TaxID=2971798 RepID=UPI00237E3804|nr:hypothetical protein [Streptomyces sp. G7(2002)]WDT58820.1 hypothetical protein NUT86_35040 [Streptomyces sp. G7(2002)]